MGKFTKTVLFSSTATAIVLVAASASAMPMQPTTADVMVVVDESLSMNTEHAWIPGMIAALDSGLIANGITGNRFGLVGFVENSGAHPGEPNRLAGPHKHTFNTGQDWLMGPVLNAGSVTGSWDLPLDDRGSIFEDGYDAIQFAFDNYSFRANAARNVILIADEDRDNRDANDTYQSILASLSANNALLNVVVNCRFNGGNAVGVDGSNDANAFTPDGNGGYTSSTGGVQSGSCSGSTKADYVDLAWENGGAAWDLNQLRSGGNTAASFTNAFVDIKVQEIQNQPLPTPVTEPAALGLFGFGLIGVGLAARRRKTH